MIGLGVCATGVAVLSAVQHVSTERVFEVRFRGPLHKIVPAIATFTRGQTTFRVERAPNLCLTVVCDREEDKTRHMINLWKAFPQLRSRAFDISRVHAQ